MMPFEFVTTLLSLMLVTIAICLIIIIVLVVWLIKNLKEYVKEKEL